MQKKVVWLLSMGFLTLVLAGIILSRLQSKTDIIFGGVEGGIIQSDTYTAVNPNATPTPEVEEDDGWPDIDITQGQYRMVNDDTEFLHCERFSCVPKRFP